MRIAFEQVSYCYDEASAKRNRAGERRREHERAKEPHYALKDITFSLDDNSFLGIIGNTGSGKSTLIRHLNGLARPTEGRVLIDGADLSDKEVTRDARRRIGMVFQFPEQQLFASTVYDDIAFGPKNFGFTADEIDARVHEALDLVHLSFEQIHAMSPFDLSGGQLRRVALAGVLACKPETLVLDEPTCGLDPEAHAELLSLVDTMHKQGHNIIMITHTMDDIAEVADKVLILNDGRMQSFGTPQEVLSDADALIGIGLMPPQAQLVAVHLKKQGFALPRTLYNEQCLAEDIANDLIRNT